MTSLVCLDFPEFIAVKMLRTLKPYFLGSCGKGLRRRTCRTSSKDLPQRAKKTALRLDEFRFSLGSPFNIRESIISGVCLVKTRFFIRKNASRLKELIFR